MNIYQAVTRISAILSVAAMAITDDASNYHNNDVFYAGVIAAIVIGPHALDKLAGGEHDWPASGTGRRVAEIMPLVGCLLSLVVRFA